MCKFPYLSILTFVVGAQKNRLTETVLLSIHNICFGVEIIIIIFNHMPLSRGLGPFFCTWLSPVTVEKDR